MGIQDRDYYREGSSRLFDAWGRQGASFYLIVVTTVVFFVECLNGNPLLSPLVIEGEYSYQGVIDGQVWRLVTSMFLHASLWHLFFNMLMLYLASSWIEDIYGPREFLAFYLVAGVFANCLRLAAQASGILPPSIGLGASGAVTAVLVLFAFHFPWQQVRLWLVFPMPVWAMVAGYIVIDSLGAVGVGPAGIGYIVHLGGALFGALYFQTGFRFSDLVRRSPRPAARRVRPKLRIVGPPDSDDTPEPVGAAVESQPRSRENGEELEAKVDAVLAKVSKLGQDSLTPEERELLFKASEIYKQRRK
jgi:membrane associated rhomboid family serine protease